LTRSRVGLVLRAVGENHDAAHSLGYNVQLIRFLAILFGGAMAGIGGAYFSLIRVPQWTEGMTAGAGWIALAIVVFAAWKPWRCLLGAYIFGGVTVLQLNFQAAQITPLWLAVLGLGIIFAAMLIGALKNPKPNWIPVGIIGSLAFASFFTALLFPVRISAQYLSMTPYIATIIVLVLISAGTLRSNLNAPASLGRTFRKVV
jgi:simple sugar transport system permease protein